MLKYKGYTGVVKYDDEAEIFHGEVINLRDVITFQGTTAKQLKQAFQDSIDDYLAFCEERGEEPEKPFSGKLILRTTPEIHKAAATAAAYAGQSLNAWIAKVIEKESVKEIAC